jgi:hypothetical protein
VSFAAVEELAAIFTALILVEMTLENRKWRFLWTSCISNTLVGNDFQQPRGNRRKRHFHMSTISTPYGGPACPGHGRPAQAVGGKGWRGDVVLVLQFGVRLLHGGFG